MATQTQLDEMEDAIREAKLAVLKQVRTLADGLAANKGWATRPVLDLAEAYATIASPARPGSSRAEGS